MDKATCKNAKMVDLMACAKVAELSFVKPLRDLQTKDGSAGKVGETSQPVRVSVKAIHKLRITPFPHVDERKDCSTATKDEGNYPHR